jgi:hypothetical protein
MISDAVYHTILVTQPVYAKTEISRKIDKHLKQFEENIIMYRNLWDLMKIAH